LVSLNVKTAIGNKKSEIVIVIKELHSYPDGERREIFEALIPLRGQLKSVPAGHRK